MNRTQRTLSRIFGALLSVTGAGLYAQDALPPAVRASLDLAIAEPWSARHDALFDASWADLGDTKKLSAELDRLIAAEPQSAAGLRWIAAFVAWRNGDLAVALRHVEAIGEDAPTSERAAVVWRRARLLEALGRNDAAQKAYRAVLEQGALPPEIESAVRLRLALCATQGSAANAKAASAALSEYASAPGRDPDLQARAATVLGLLGDPAAALAMPRAEPADASAADRCRTAIRAATWAIRAGDAANAQSLAWSARELATVARDRSYALALLVEAHRLDDSLGALIERFAAEPELDEPSRQTWIDLLRETGQIDAAVSLFRNAADDFSIDMQRELIEMYREAGRDAELIATYGELIARDPSRLAWREGASRFHLERGDAAAARAVWTSYLDDAALRPYLLAAATTMMDLGLEDIATAAAETCIAEDRDRHAALLMLFDAHKRRGRLKEARAELDRLDGFAPPDSADRASLAEAYEQIGVEDRAIEVLEGLRRARGTATLAEDLEMRLAWLYSQVGDDESAMQRWHELWLRVESEGRRRYVEDRLMTVASRLGKIAKIVVDLETKLAAGEADSRDSGLLVRLYTKVNDPVSAAEVIDEFFARSGAAANGSANNTAAIDAVQQKARVYLACTDYASYEDSLRRLIELDPEGEAEYLRNLVMSQLERGRPDEARAALTRLRGIERGFDSAEFEAGVLALAGLRDEAALAYRRGVALHPGRIEIYLLLANLLRESGQHERAIGMFQHLAETAEQDDMFTIAIDGLLNMEAPPPVLQWARRITLERLAGKHDKAYLYQLLADLSDELQEAPAALDALEGSLAIAGERRPSILRELMDRAKGDARGRGGDRARHLAYGRRLIGLAEIVPPQVYLELGQVFLESDEIVNAVKTFGLARDVADRATFQRQVAAAFEAAGYLRQALQSYQQVLVGAPSDVSLLVQVAALHEQLGRDDSAFELYSRAIDLLLDREPLRSGKNVSEDTSKQPSWLAGRNVDDGQRYLPIATEGLLVTARDAAALRHHFDALAARFGAALAEFRQGALEGESPTLAQAPRLGAMATIVRRIAFALSEPKLADPLDLQLVDLLRGETGLLETLCRERIAGGMTASAHALAARADIDEARRRALQFALGVSGVDGGATRALPLPQAARAVVPRLVNGELDAATIVLQQADVATASAEDLEQAPVLVTAARFLGDEARVAALAGASIRAMFRARTSAYQITSAYEAYSFGLSPAARRSLDELVVDQVLANIDEARAFLRYLPEMQARYTEPLLTPERVAELLEKSEFTYAYGLAPLLELLPASERTSTLRQIWNKVPKSGQLAFLLGVLSESEQAIPAELGEFFVAALPDAVEQHTDPFRYVGHLCEELQACEPENRELVARVAAALSTARPKEFAPRLLEATLALGQVDGEQRGLELGLGAMREALSLKEDYEWNGVVEQIDKHFFPRHADRFLAELATLGGATALHTRRRLDLVAALDDPSRLLSELRVAVERHPEDVDLSNRLQWALDAAGFRVDAALELERLLQRKPGDEALQRRWITKLKSLHRHADAEAAQRALDAKKTGGAESVAADAVPANARKIPAPSIEVVRDHVEASDSAAAREEFRRLWRFGEAMRRRSMLSSLALSRVMFVGVRSASLVWPTDDAAEETDDATARERRARGGLAGFAATVPEAAPTESAYDVLAKQEFGREEIERQVRSMPLESLDRSPQLVGALRLALVEEVGRDAALERLHERVQTGRATRLHLLQLFELMREAAAESTLDQRFVDLANELVRTVDPNDSQQMLELARVFAALGREDDALRLYLWCAIATRSGARGVVSGNKILDAARPNLARERLVSLAEDVLRWSEADTRWERERYELLVFDTWEQTVDAEEALRRCRPICEAVRDVQKQLRRTSALRAAVMLGRAGELDDAIACLEIALCTLPTDGLDLEYSWDRAAYETPGTLNDDALRRMFPVDAAAWREPSAFWQRVVAASEAWFSAGRIDESEAIRIACLAAVRLQALDKIDAAHAALASWRERSPAAADDALWLADATRELGDAEHADTIERRLLTERRLAIARIPDVIGRVARAEGAVTALALGTEAARYTSFLPLLELLAELATEAGDAKARAEWEQKIAAARAAA